jgi:hypothetical protein
MNKRVAVTLALELSEDIDYLDCSDVQKEAIALSGCHLYGMFT